MAQVSDQALLAKTGKTLKQWVKIIDGFGGEDMTHKQIAQKLWDLYCAQDSQAYSAHGAAEERSKPYQEYSARVSQSATKRTAASTVSVASSARQQDSAVQTLSGWWCQ